MQSVSGSVLRSQAGLSTTVPALARALVGPGPGSGGRSGFSNTALPGNLNTHQPGKLNIFFCIFTEIFLCAFSHIFTDQAKFSLYFIYVHINLIYHICWFPFLCIILVLFSLDSSVISSVSLYSRQV